MLFFIKANFTPYCFRILKFLLSAAQLKISTFH